MYRTDGVIQKDILTSTLFDLTGKAEKCSKLKKLKLTWWKRLIDSWVVMMVRPQRRKLADWLRIME